jgi:hypothetical protein
MTYNKKVMVLSSIIAALALVYVLTIVFEPERALSRSAAYTWLDPKLADLADRISLGDSADPVKLVRKNNEWFVSHNGNNYPAKQLRVGDFIGLLAKRAPYPIRSANAASHQRLGLAENAAFRIVVSGGAGLPLLDLLVGQADQTGREVYLRRQGENEVRSGEDFFTAYIAASRASWYNLRLFPGSEDGGLELDAVQRLTVYDGAQAGAAPLVFTRNGRDWAISGMDNAVETGRTDAYIRGILAAEGDDFSDSIDPEDPLFNHSRITLELGDGSVRTIRLGPPDESNRRFALVPPSRYVYSLAGWTVERLFRDAAYFEKQD